MSFAPALPGRGDATLTNRLLIGFLSFQVVSSALDIMLSRRVGLPKSWVISMATSAASVLFLLIAELSSAVWVTIVCFVIAGVLAVASFVAVRRYRRSLRRA